MSDLNPCISHHTGKPLKSYLSEFEAQMAAERSSLLHGNPMVPYLCDRCGQWHLCPESRHTPSKTCNHCTSSSGKPKKLYPTKEIAEKRARIIYEERRIRLTAYSCPVGQGWHLTKNDLW